MDEFRIVLNRWEKFCGGNDFAARTLPAYEAFDALDVARFCRNLWLIECYDFAPTNGVAKRALFFFSGHRQVYRVTGLRNLPSAR